MKHFCLTFTLLIFQLCIHAQFLPNDEIFKRTARQSTICPPEKVYIHTDRNNYVAGEKIWMRAHVVDGIAHVPMNLSRYVYVTLQNPFLETITTIRLLADKDGYIHGNLPLPIDLAKGEYILTAYTRYQENFESEYFFKKRIFISSMLNSNIQTKTTWEDNNLNIQFIDPQTGQKLKIKDCNAKTELEQIHVQSENSTFKIQRNDINNKCILVKTGNYQEFIYPQKEMDYDISFMPEGGHLIPDAFCRVAFKAINEMGLGENVTGTLRDDKDSILLHFKSYYKGMGIISYFPKTNKKYTVVCQNENGVTKRFNLPSPDGNYTMQVNQINEKIFVKVLFNPNIINDESLLVFAHQRGWPVKVGKWSKKTPGLVCKQDDFLDGAASFLLINERGHIVGERMIFINRNEQIKTGEIKTTFPEGQNKKISLKLQTSEKWWTGDCSVSITNNADVLPDSCENLLTSLLLSSDLRGHIESPSWYFKEGDDDLQKLQKIALEALMMTQGWKKYDLKKAWTENYREPLPLPEQWQVLSGKVTKRISGAPIEKAVVKLMIPDAGITVEKKTNKDGLFYFTNIDMPDSTRFWFTAHSPKKGKNIVIELDSIVYPILNVKLPPKRPISPTSSPIENLNLNHLSKVNSNYQDETGIRHLYLDEIIITAPKNTSKTEYEKIAGVKSIKEDEIAQSNNHNIITLLKQKIAGLSLMIKEDKKTKEQYQIIAIRGEVVAIVLDGSFLNPLMIDTNENIQAMQIIESLRVEDIEQIDVIKGTQAIGFHSKATGGLIAITTKSGNSISNAEYTVTNLKSIMPLGFQKPTAFYSPPYELTSENSNSHSRLRTTIHWQPRLEVKNGKATIEFYTTDEPIDYSVVIEGVGEDGSLLRTEKIITKNYNEL